jgi:hypothetical protein
MPKLSVLVSAQNEILGTFQGDSSGGANAPAQMGFQAAPGQRVVEIEVDDATAHLDPEALHNKIKADHLR